jgi:hypothetical protein
MARRERRLALDGEPIDGPAREDPADRLARTTP